MNTQHRFEIRILSENIDFSQRLERRLSSNENWLCTVKRSAEKEFDKLNHGVNVLVVVYGFDPLTPDVVLQKLKTNYPDAKILSIIPEDAILKPKDFLLDKKVIDVIRMCSIVSDMVFNHVRNIYDEWKLQAKYDKLSEQNDNTFLSNAEAMQPIQSLIEKAADSEISVSISGQTGTGKEVVARRIHNLSERKNEPFVAVNVAAIPSELVESAFFGHEKGAFTGAVARKIGYFESASGGTLFLDEIGDMDTTMQVKLLRVLQEGVITRVGGTGEIKINVRIITATHKDLQQLVNDSKFREDLYYRLMGIVIDLPPLVEREGDVIMLAEHFIRQYCTKNKKALCALSEEARQVLTTYSFPGNVRELKAMMELAVVLCSNNVIKSSDLTLRGKPANKKEFLDEEKTLEQYDQMIIKHFMKKYDHKVRIVADKLGISKTKIYKLIQEDKL